MNPRERPIDGAMGAEWMYLPARAGGLTFALSAASALAVFKLDNLTRAPGAPEHVQGIANTKYGIVAVVCVARWLNAGALGSVLGALVVLVEHACEIVALAVEQVDEAIIAVQEENASASTLASPAFSAPATGVLRLAPSTIPVLDLSSLFDSRGILENVSPLASKE